ncbi:hypothetical protein SRABI96_03338 [Peribacillus sp. Bi96]|nr:hypothetical protein SRABI96_03338 [Peribacillus sp. Bi96]
MLTQSQTIILIFKERACVGIRKTEDVSLMAGL